MAREHSHIRKKRKKGCLTGCLVHIMLFLGVLALLFVLACVTGVIQNDPETGAPYMSLDNIHIGGFSLSEITLPDWNLPDWNLPDIELPQISLPDFELPTWAYGLESEGLTVKTLRAGSGEAILVCADGYTMLVGAGEGGGWVLAGQLLLCGVNDLNVAAAVQSSDAQIGGMKLILENFTPEYLLYRDSQIKGSAYNAMIGAAQKAEGLQPILAAKGVSFALGRAAVTVLGPVRSGHSDDRDDGVTLRIDYGETSVLIMGGITASGEQELLDAGVPLDADVIICSGSEDASGALLVEAVSPQYALLTGEAPANPVKIRYQRAAARVYTMEEHGVMTVTSDGKTIEIEP